MLTAAAIAFAGLCGAAHLASTGLALGRTRQSTAPALSRFPFITLLRPVCGLDPFDAETLGSSFTQDYPAYEVIFCVARRDDPVVGLVEELIAKHPHVAARLLIGDSRITGNPKLNNLHKGWLATSAEWIAMADSNLLLPKDYLQTLASSWRQDSGLVSGPPIGIRPQGFAASLECAFLNGNQARLQLAADSLGLGFAQGKTLFWRRDLLDRAGGLQALGKDMAEDAAATKLVRDLGWRVTLPPRPFAQPIGRRSFGAVWGRQLRWSRVRRDGFPQLFLSEVLNTPVLPALALALTVGLWATGLLFFVLYAAEVALLIRFGWPHGWRDLLAMPMRDLLILPLWAATFVSRGFEWRGTAMAPVDGPDQDDALLLPE